MSYLFTRGKTNKVYLGFTDKFGKRKHISLKISLGRTLPKRNGKITYPSSVIVFQRQFEAKLHLGIEPNPRIKHIRLSQVLEKYLETQGSERKESTKRNYLLAIKKLTDHFGDCAIIALTEEQMFEWRRKTIESDGKVNTAIYIRTFSPIFNFAVRKGYLRTSPIVHGFRLNPPSPPPLVYQDNEFDLVLQYARKRPHLFNQLKFLDLTGFRVSESCSLKWKQIESDKINVYNEKENRYEPFPLDESLKNLLNDLPREDEYVFHFRQATSINKALRDIFEKMKKDKIEITPELSVHNIRKTFGSRLVKRGVDFSIVHKLMRHRDPKTTMQYYIWFGLDTLRSGLEKSRNVL